ncbi:hypothetical protein X766_16000 [Mesorhizobium sp. LSJC255A00]|nr:hypothetical protein [Mesorhizobium sp. LSJC255A00]ESX17893.1 hypothetical protein X766_16000 [Mesorhizobium sp. LSJC255A00]
MKKIIILAVALLCAGCASARYNDHYVGDSTGCSGIPSCYSPVE